MDPFRRVRPGEAVRITATAWNALMEIVRPSTPTQGSEKATPSLPATIATLRGASAAMGEAVILRSLNSGAGAPATTPVSSSTTFSTVEKRLWNGHKPLFASMLPTTSGLSPDDPFAICIDPLRSRFAIGGLAWVRVRTVRQWHRFARRCIALPTDGTEQLAAVAGCLDSCGWGPAEILGYAPTDFDPTVSTPLTDIRGNGSFTAGSILWALVRF